MYYFACVNIFQNKSYFIKTVFLHWKYCVTRAISFNFSFFFFWLIQFLFFKRRKCFEICSSFENNILVSSNFSSVFPFEKQVSIFIIEQQLVQRIIFVVQSHVLFNYNSPC